jgi:hypothetical protein
MTSGDGLTSVYSLHIVMIAVVTNVYIFYRRRFCVISVLCHRPSSRPFMRGSHTSQVAPVSAKVGYPPTQRGDGAACLALKGDSARLLGMCLCLAAVVKVGEIKARGRRCRPRAGMPSRTGNVHRTPAWSAAWNDGPSNEGRRLSATLRSNDGNKHA